MTRAIQLAKLALLLTAAGLCALLGLLAWRASAAIIDLSRKVDETASQVQPAIRNLNQATAEWSAASKAQAQSVTAIERDVRVEMWQVDRTLQTAQGTFSAASTAIAAIGSDADAVKPLIGSGVGAVNSFSSALDQYKGTAVALTRTAESVNQRVNDPAITQTLHNINGITGSADKMLADAQEKEHQLLHPDKKRLGFWGVVGAGVMWVHRLLPPIF